MIKITYSAGKIYPSGSIECRAYAYGELLTVRVYMGYTRKEALKRFRGHVKEVLSQGIYGPRLYY